MDKSIIEGYIEKVYGYAIGHTYSREEADELSQEILFTAVRELPKLRDEGKFEPWLWGIASNVTKSFRRYKGKQRAVYSYDTLTDLSYEDEYDDEQEKTYDLLRTRIAMLSSIYRDIIILYYYDSLSTKEISERLNIPEGTVTWRLSEARRKLKKECTEMNESALRPVKMDIRINGEGNYNGITRPYPWMYISDALSQNILYHCYDQPRTVEELAKLCGVPAYYVEDCLSNLIKREAISEPQKGKYRTEFIIYKNKELDEYEESAKGIFDGMTEKFVCSMNTLADAVEELKIYDAGKSRDELIYLYGMLSLEHLSEKYNPVKAAPHPTRYDGCRFSYHAHLHSPEDNKKTVHRGLGRECSANLGSRGKCRHISYHFGGFSYRKMMYDSEINVCEDILCGRKIEDEYSLASAIENGYVSKKEDKLFVNIPMFTKDQYEKFISCAEKAFENTIELYSKAVAKYLEGYKKLFPAHLKDEVERACNYMFLCLYAAGICGDAKEKGLLTPPSDGSVCDVIIQYK